jgi:sodium-dependent dicarboxylate transporter 2/3/5
MMLPIALSVLDRFGVRMQDDVDEADSSSGPGATNLAVCLTLGIAYAASIGGLGSPLGSPPNAIALGYLSSNGVSVSFATWLLFALPVVVIFLPLAWLVLTRHLYPIRDEQFDAAAGESIHAPLGPMNRGEIVTAVVFLSAVVLWILRSAYDHIMIGSVKPFAGSGGDALIAMAAAVALFVIPASTAPRRFVMDWITAAKLPWGVLLLFGGGLSLAGALAYAPEGTEGIHYASFSAYLAEQLAALSAWPLFFMLLATVVLVIFLTELTSNTATANTLVPILGALAVTLGVAPTTLVLPAALAATCAFMLPVATPPNAIVYASGHIRMGQMVRAGFVLNLIGVVLITLMMYFLLPVVLG